MIEISALDRLRELTLAQKAIEKETEEWWLTHIKPLVDSSPTWNDFLRAIVDVHVFDENLQVLPMPGFWKVYMDYAADSFRQKEKGLT